MLAFQRGIEYCEAKYFGINDRIPATPIMLRQEDSVIAVYTGLPRTLSTALKKPAIDIVYYSSSPAKVSSYVPFDKPFAPRPSKFIISAD